MMWSKNSLILPPGLSFEEGAVMQLKDNTQGKTTASGKSAKTGLTIKRRYTKPGASVWDTVVWEKRSATISNDHAEVIFQQKNVEIPATWSMLATNMVVSKYFRGAIGRSSSDQPFKKL